MRLRAYRVTLDTMVSGYVQALERFERATGEAESNVFFPLFEALGWAYSIDNHWLGDSDEPLLVATRWVRGVVQHGWADALVTRDFPAEGITTYTVSRAPIQATSSIGHALVPTQRRVMITSDWYWRPAAELPPSRDEGGRAAYARNLEGEPARTTLHQLADFFLVLDPNDAARAS